MSSPKNILVDIWLVASLARRLVEDGLADSTLSVDEFAVYGLIADLGPVTATQLSQWTAVPSTTMSAMIRRCQNRGELRRSSNPADGRSALLSLTARGRAVYVRSLPALAQALAGVHAGLTGGDTAARHQLQLLDSALRDALGAEPRPYAVDRGESAGERSVPYTGEPLTPAQLAEATNFFDWIRHRDLPRQAQRSRNREAPGARSPLS